MSRKINVYSKKQTVIFLLVWMKDDTLTALAVYHEFFAPNPTLQNFQRNAFEVC